MKNFLILLSFLLIFTSKSVSQTVIAFDYMEAWNWPGFWFGNTFNSTWATNFSVSPNESAVIYGSGNSSSGFEQDWYILPNITGLDPNNQYEFRFRLASYRITSSSSTRGVDVGDFVDIQVSYDGGFFYGSELRITGNSNAFWDYNTNGIINHVADGTFVNALSPAGDVYRSGPGNQQFTGPSVIILQLPLGITQVAVDIFCRVNSNGEEWWLDNIELVEITNTPLPVTLTSFTTECNNGIPVLKWTTASEQNSDYFQIERSRDGFDWIPLSKVQAMGNSNTTKNYQFYDMNSGYFESYYRLKQVDFDGAFEYYNPIYSKCVQFEYFEFELYPNPVEDVLIIKLINLSSNEVQLNLFDATGRSICSSHNMLENKNDLISLNMQHLHTGQYLLEISSGSDILTKRVIKK